MGAKKKAKPKKPEFTEELGTNERLERIESLLAMLVEGAFEQDTPKTKAKGLKATLRSKQARALRARIGLAAKTHGMTMDAWIKKYGHVDRLPDED